MAYEKNTQQHNFPVIIVSHWAVLKKKKDSENLKFN